VTKSRNGRQQKIQKNVAGDICFVHPHRINVTSLAISLQVFDPHVETTIFPPTLGSGRVTVELVAWLSSVCPSVCYGCIVAEL